MLQLTADVDVDRLDLAAAEARRAGTPVAYRAALVLYRGELLPENRHDDWAAQRRDALAGLAAALQHELGAPGADPRLIPDAVAAALDVRALPGQELLDAVVDFVAPRSLLLVVDNCEHLLTATAGLADTLLRSAPGLTIVATSREPLRVRGEVVFPVPSLEIPDPEHVRGPRELLRYEAVRLFVERAGAAAPGFALDEENAADVARICFRLDGLPLALELAAGRLGALGPAAIAERLDDRFRVLKTASRTSPTRQHTLEATLQWSHDLLEPDERTLFRRLAVFAGGFDLEAVEAVSEPDVADVLARLVDKSLVTADDRTSRGRRYRLLETVRMYARERLEEAGEADALAERHAEWALALAERERGSPRLDRDEANLRAALATLLERAPTEALRLCVALLPFWLRRIDLHEAQCRFDEALAAGRSPEALLAAAAIDFRGGDLHRALAHAEESHAVASEIGDPKAEWRALQFLGECGIASDEVAVAAPWLARALALARQHRFAAEEAIGVYSLGVTAWIVGDLARADELVAQSAELFAALGGSQLAEGALPAAREALDEALGLRCGQRDRRGIGLALAGIALIDTAAGDHGSAERHLAEAGDIFRRAGDRWGLASTLWRTADLALTLGLLDDADRALEEARAVLGATRRERWIAHTLFALAEVALRRGDTERAFGLLRDAHDRYSARDDALGVADTEGRLRSLLRGD